MNRILLTIFFLTPTFALAQLTVVTSIHPYYSLVQQLVLEDAEVIRLLPPGASPHTFDPTPRDVARLAEADLVVLNGGLDEWLKDLVAASGRNPELIEALEVVEFEMLAGEGHGDENHNGVNPHIWLEPSLMVDFIPALAAHLARLDPEHTERYVANAEALLKDLHELDTELAELLAGAKGKSFVPFHDAWPYFARHYGLDLVAVIEPAPGREPSVRYLTETLDRVAKSGAKAIFGEVQLPPRPAEVIAENAGVALYLLDPIGGNADTETYQDLLRYNARVIADALK